MARKKEQELKYITQEEVEEKIKNHLLVLRWWKEIDNSFSWYIYIDIG